MKASFFVPKAYSCFGGKGCLPQKTRLVPLLRIRRPFDISALIFAVTGKDFAMSSAGFTMPNTISSFLR